MRLLAKHRHSTSNSQVVNRLFATVMTGSNSVEYTRGTHCSWAGRIPCTHRSGVLCVSSTARLESRYSPEGENKFGRLFDNAFRRYTLGVRGESMGRPGRLLGSRRYSSPIAIFLLGMAGGLFVAP